MYEKKDRDSRGNFGTFVGRWLDQVHDDHQISGEFFRVAYSIRRHLSRSTLTCFPGNETLRIQAAVSERTVQRALAKLEERGHLKVHASVKKRPRMLVPLLNEGAILTPEKMPPIDAVDCKGDTIGDTMGDNDFEVHQRNQDSYAVNLRDSRNLRESRALARASPNDSIGNECDIAEAPRSCLTDDERLSLDIIFEMNTETERLGHEHRGSPNRAPPIVF